ncbi:MAG: hypothetical protein Q4F84_01285 [Fibrobacter sp.]|nr:hypothetical protein [Fibrobacter sp.]
MSVRRAHTTHAIAHCSSANPVYGRVEPFFWDNPEQKPDSFIQSECYSQKKSQYHSRGELQHGAGKLDYGDWSIWL